MQQSESTYVTSVHDAVQSLSLLEISENGLVGHVTQMQLSY